ncbi:MAG: SMP-30/gluconolactonase/LRE family protein [Bryobacteraceae bacterium]
MKMNFLAVCTRVRIPAFAGLLLASSLLAQPPAGKRAPEPQGVREVTVTEIPGVVAAGAKWELVWQGPDNADGIVGTPDGGLLVAKEQPNQIAKLDKSGQPSVYLDNPHGPGSVAIDAKGRLLAVERTCTDPGRNPENCKEATAISMLASKGAGTAKPVAERKVLADNIDGKSLGRINDLVVSKKGHVYFTSNGAFFLPSGGKVSTFGENLRTNGIMLSRDEKSLYITNGNTVAVFDIQADGTPKNQREFGKLEAGGNGDGLAIDADGRLYVTSQPGVQVFSAGGKYLGVIPTPRAVISVAFAGADKKALYVVGSGSLGPDGKEFRTPEGVRNNAKTIYKLATLTQGFKGRAK